LESAIIHGGGLNSLQKLKCPEFNPDILILKRVKHFGSRVQEGGNAFSRMIFGCVILTVWIIDTYT